MSGRILVRQKRIVDLELLHLATVTWGLQHSCLLDPDHETLPSISDSITC